MKLKIYSLISLCMVMAAIVGFCYIKQQETIIVGLNLALSGEEQAHGESTERGIILAKNQLNAKGGLLGRPVKLVSVDNHGKPDDAAIAVQQLNMRHVAAIIGPNEHDCAAAAIPYIVDKKIPMISPAGTAEDITVDTQQNTVYPYVFRMAFLNSQQGNIIASYAMEMCKAKKIAIFYDDTEPSQELAGHVKKAIEQHGGEVLRYQQISDGESLAASISALQDCQAVYMPVDQDKAAAWIPYLRDSHIACPVLGTASWQGEILAANLQEGYLKNVFYISQYAADVHDTLSEEFAENYYEMYGELPDTYAALGYDSFMLLAKAVEAGQSVTGRDIIHQLMQMDSYRGVTGDCRFDEKHNPNKPGYILTFWGKDPIILGKHHAADI